MFKLDRLQQHLESRPRLARPAYFVAGALTMLSFAPFGYYLLAPLLLLPVLYSSFVLQPRTAAWLGFSYGAGLFLAGTYWLYTSIHVFGKAPLWVALIVMLGLVLIMASYYALGAWLINRLAAGNVLRLLIVGPAIWVGSEWLRGWFMSGFPWMTLGYGQIDSPLAGFAPIVGVYGVSLMVSLSGTALLVALLSTSRRRSLMLAVAVVPWLAGAALQQLSWISPAGPAVQATIVQGGVSQDQKWERDQFWKTLNLYQASIDQHPDSDLLVWPEVALPAVDYYIADFLQALDDHVAVRGQTLLVGVLEASGPDAPIYNSVLKLDGGERQVYRKRHLVPFGEYFPVPGFVRNWMRMMSLPNSDLQAGEDDQPLLVTAGGLKLAVAICYEDAYPAEQLSGLPDASILINVSNDAWFGDSIAPHQHLEIARMRALEVARYVIRSTNNGVSAFIGPDGTVLEQGPQFEYVAMTREVTPLNGYTPYARFGNWPVVVLCLLLVAATYRRR